MNGFLNFLKPPDMTSSDAVVLVRKLLPKGTKIGHAGTLDPEAAGVLPLMIGKATRLFDFVVDKQKQYLAEITLGIITDTQDATGQILTKQDVMVTQEDLANALPSFIGEIAQIPPAYSALKVQGKKLYELARAGQDVEIAARHVQVYGLTLVEARGDNRYLLKIDCGKGTYIRTICHDIGQMLGCGAHMSFLLRTKAGPFCLEEALTPQEVLQIHEQGYLEKHLIPMDLALPALPKVIAEDTWLEKIRCGNLEAEWLDDLPQGPFLVYCQNAFCGVAYITDGRPHFHAMLL